MQPLLDPWNDLVFKRIFGEHKHLCISLLNSLLPLSNPIVEIEYLTAEQIPLHYMLKYSIVNAYCKDSIGSKFVAVVHLGSVYSLQKRLSLDVSKVYVRNIEIAKAYEQMEPIYSLNLVYDTIYKDLPEYIHHNQTVNIAHTEKQIEGLEFVLVELPKFKAQNILENKSQALWLRFLTELQNQTEIPDDFTHDPFMIEAVELLKRDSYTVQQLNMYDKILDSIVSERTLMEAKLAEGRAQGRAMFLRETAMRMLADGLSFDLIAKCTNLSLEEILKIEQDRREV